MTALELKLGIAAAVLFALVVLIGAYSWHEREVGRATLQHSVDAATAQAEAKAAAQTVQLQAKAEMAMQESMNAQDQLAKYMDTHPIGPVVVQHCPAPGRAGVPTTASNATPLPSSAPSPGSLPSVPAGAPRDIGPGLAVIVRAAGELSVATRYLQQR